MPSWPGPVPVPVLVRLRGEGKPLFNNTRRRLRHDGKIHLSNCNSKGNSGRWNLITGFGREDVSLQSCQKHLKNKIIIISCCYAGSSSVQSRGPAGMALSHRRRIPCWLHTQLQHSESVHTGQPKQELHTLLRKEKTNNTVGLWKKICLTQLSLLTCLTCCFSNPATDKYCMS